MPESDLNTDTWPADLDLSGYDALLFDLDGTLVDTMTVHGRAYGEVFAHLGHRLKMEDYLAAIGPPARVAIRSYARAAGMGEIDDQMVANIHALKKARFGEVLARDGARALPASSLIEKWRGRRAMAVVSSGNRDGVTRILDHMGWTASLSAVVTGDDTVEGKPAPAPYLRAAELLQVSPALCLAFEDTVSGISAARAARMDVIDVTRPGMIHRRSVQAGTQ
ncbi:HAD family phosphatase [Neorhizobium galegae]|uniref:HAD family hydrolase n=1 Tax=Neorhizobium galegae TaxID=399 RepID=UPI000621D371|nr:HAD-IA family hydrolase [Neorhizobium galegae]CDZ25171.1 Phosphatase YqaB [Neorhizobium galegae bv. officinalis]KAA9387956.1 HAD-IA family hydrolase [Neorhizobium galegae]KAB1115580.1 HAD-IA family hydrolase [Neorhizobium galegae]MCM2496698.1 HAD-IA family hydrolase [Neorhizobium galegae]MCQ1765902.1 HAD-IA family hydrolase [Neorhizobium galegae]